MALLWFVSPLVSFNTTEANVESERPCVAQAQRAVSSSADVPRPDVAQMDGQPWSGSRLHKFKHQDTRHADPTLFAASSARLLILAVSLHVACTALGVAKYSSAFLSISYPLPLRAEDASIQRYGKGPKDLCFLVFYILVFSLIRQGAIQYFITPLARLGGISNKKLDRFNEQGYALLYWSASSIVGLVRSALKLA